MDLDFKKNKAHLGNRYVKFGAAWLNFRGGGADEPMHTTVHAILVFYIFVHRPI